MAVAVLVVFLQPVGFSRQAGQADRNHRHTFEGLAAQVDALGEAPAEHREARDVVAGREGGQEAVPIRAGHARFLRDHLRVRIGELEGATDFFQIGVRRREDQIVAGVRHRHGGERRRDGRQTRVAFAVGSLDVLGDEDQLVCGREG